MIIAQQNEWMKLALEQAHMALDQDEVPVGAIIIRNKSVITSAFNQMKTRNDPTAHAELLAIQQAIQKLQTPYLQDCDLYVTLEPCSMCAGAIALSRLRRIYFSAYDPKGGAVDHGAHIFDHTLHRPEVYGGICEAQSNKLLKKFFIGKR
jgi:tRNA(adenine34) deaminase